MVTWPWTNERSEYKLVLLIYTQFSRPLNLHICTVSDNTLFNPSQHSLFISCHCCSSTYIILIINNRSFVSTFHLSSLNHLLDSFRQPQSFCFSPTSSRTCHVLLVITLTIYSTPLSHAWLKTHLFKNASRHRRSSSLTTLPAWTRTRMAYSILIGSLPYAGNCVRFCF